MRKLVLSALLLASAFQTALGQTYTSGDWEYTVSNNEAAITAYMGSASAVTIPSSVNGISVVQVGNRMRSIFGLNGNFFVTSITIPSSVKSILEYAFASSYGLTSITIPSSVTSIGESVFYSCRSLASITIPNSVMSIGVRAFYDCPALTNITMPDRFITQVSSFGLSANVATDYLVNALANNDGFVTAVANKILAKSDNYGLAVKSELETLATYSELTSAIEPLATKTQITTAINEGKASGIASVTASPNTWSLFTTSQIQNMAVDDLVLTRQEGGGFVLNYDIEQSTDLQTWTTYAPLSLPLTGLPTDKAFVRIKVINSNSPALPPVLTPTEPSATPVGSNL
jgi:hypothetical protein